MKCHLTSASSGWLIGPFPFPFPFPTALAHERFEVYLDEIVEQPPRGRGHR
jgi:hypothetical protein